MNKACLGPDLKPNLPSPSKLNSPGNFLLHPDLGFVLGEQRTAQCVSNNAAKGTTVPKHTQGGRRPRLSVPLGPQSPTCNLQRNISAAWATARLFRSTTQLFQWGKPLCKPSTHTQQTGNSRICCISWIQINFMGMESCWCNGKVTTKPVNVLDKGYIHFQGPFAGCFLSMSCINAGTPET